MQQGVLRGCVERMGWSVVREDMIWYERGYMFAPHSISLVQQGVLRGGVERMGWSVVR